MPTMCSILAEATKTEIFATIGSCEDRELRKQLAMLADMVERQSSATRKQAEALRRQEGRMKWLEDLLIFTTSAIGGAVATPKSVMPNSSHSIPSTGLGEEVMLTPPVRSSPARTVIPTTVSGAEQDRLMALRNDEDEARMFELGLRPWIFRLVRPLYLQTYREVVDYTLIVERDAEIAKEEREAIDRSKDKRQAVEGANSKPSLRRPQKHPRSQSQGHGSSSYHGAPDRRQLSCCMIYGGPHVPLQCPQRGGKYYQCGQKGQFRFECSRGSSSTPSIALAPAFLSHGQGTPPTWSETA
uniref:Uncharacterized protein n=1 Tax=Ananas comosus var. bracteatus TaxID=296719 RepID=A0A6V7PQ10_ANACO|nr:unnamed protein product [Ananas comosus var. bracteatus]